MALISHKIELIPNVEQKIYFAKACGIARVAYNWALKKSSEMYDEWKKDNTKPYPYEGVLRKEFNKIKKTEDYKWVCEVSKCVPQQAVKNLGRAFQNLFKGKAKFPKKKRKFVNDAFYIDNTQFAVSGKRFRIPKLGWVKMHEKIRFSGEGVIFKSATISRQADRWFVSFSCEVPDELLQKRVADKGSVGVDLGITTLATLSDGTKIAGPKALCKKLKKLKRLSRIMSRRRKGGKNRAKARLKVARLHRRIANIRKDATHKITTMLTKNFNLVSVETLNVSGMMKNEKLARHIADMSFFELRRQLEYKGQLYACEIYMADQWYPSTKLCSACGSKNNDLTLEDRMWECGCGAKHDRDINAAINLKNLAVAKLARLAVSYTVPACGTEELSSSHASGKNELSVKASQEKEAGIIRSYRPDALVRFE